MKIKCQVLKTVLEKCISASILSMVLHNWTVPCATLPCCDPTHQIARNPQLCSVWSKRLGSNRINVFSGDSDCADFHIYSKVLNHNHVGDREGTDSEVLYWKVKSVLARRYLQETKTQQASAWSSGCAAGRRAFHGGRKWCQWFGRPEVYQCVSPLLQGVIEDITSGFV